jgi:hypothetical protein
MIRFEISSECASIKDDRSAGENRLLCKFPPSVRRRVCPLLTLVLVTPAGTFPKAILVIYHDEDAEISRKDWFQLI